MEWQRIHSMGESPFRYDKGFDDDTFCVDVANNGFEMYADTSVRVKHLFMKRPWRWEDYSVK